MRLIWSNPIRWMSAMNIPTLARSKATTSQSADQWNSSRPASVDPRQRCDRIEKCGGEYAESVRHHRIARYPQHEAW